MALDRTSPVYKINFTDGTYLCALNGGDDRRKYPTPGQYEEIIPAFFISDLDDEIEVTKTDKDGNTWVITNDYIKVNNTTYTRNGTLMYMMYNPTTGKLHSVDVSSVTIPSMREYANQPGHPYAVDGTVYMRDTTGTDYSSLGAAIAAAENAYANSPVGGSPAWYYINNITAKGPRVPCEGLNIWYGEALSLGNRSLSQLIRGNQGTSTGAAFDLSDSLEEFDPDIEKVPTNDPFEPGGDSSDNDPGADGTYTDLNDDIDIPGLPTISATDAGFITLFNPNLTQLRDLASYMWTGLFDPNNFRKIFADPMDCILGLSIVPVAIPNGSPKTVQVGNVPTTVSMTTAAQQYIEVPCGSLTINEYWGAYLDYSPYTKMEIYLPYIGTHPLDIDEVMGKTITVTYHVDILSGACTAYVKCGGSVLYSFIGQCSSSIPITGNDWTTMINGIIQIAGSIGSMVASGGASAPMVAGIASTAVNSLKPTVEKSGSMSGTGGMLAIQKPYLIISRPRQALPRSQNSFMGYPAFKTVFLKEVSGYTEVESIHLSNVPGTDVEITEILQLLERGVIL